MDYIITGFLVWAALCVLCVIYVTIIVRKEMRATVSHARKLQKDNPDELSIFRAPEGWGTGKVIELQARRAK